MGPGKCLTATETGLSSAYKIRPSFPWETEGRNSQHTDKHKLHNARNMHTRTPRSQDRAMERKSTPSSAVPWEVQHGGMVGYHLVNLTQESKIRKCGCQNCTQASLVHETIPQCDHLPLGTVDIIADHADQNHSTAVFRKDPRDSFHTIMARQKTNSY